MLLPELAVGAAAETINRWLKESSSPQRRAVMELIGVALLILIFSIVALLAWGATSTLLRGIDLDSPSVRPLYQDTFQGIIQVVGVLGGASIAAYAFLSGSSGSRSTAEGVRKKQQFGGQLKSVLFYGVFVILVGLYLSVTSVLEGKELLVAGLGVLFLIHLLMTGSFVNQCVGLAR